MTGESNGKKTMIPNANSSPCEASRPSKAIADSSNPSTICSAPAKNSSSHSAVLNNSSMGSKRSSGLKSTTTSNAKGLASKATKEDSSSSNIIPHLPPFESAFEEISGLQLPGWGGEEGIELNLKSTKWQERKASMELLGAVECAKIINGHLPALLSVLKEHTKSFKDANVNVMKSFVNSLSSILRIHSVPLTVNDKKSLAAVLTVVVEKLSDRKLGELISDFLMVSGEVAGPSFIAECLIQAATSGIKAPLSRIELINWMGKFVNDVSWLSKYAIGCWGYCCLFC